MLFSIAVCLSRIVLMRMSSFSSLVSPPEASVSRVSDYEGKRREMMKRSIPNRMSRPEDDSTCGPSTIGSSS